MRTVLLAMLLSACGAPDERPSPPAPAPAPAPAPHIAMRAVLDADPRIMGAIHTESVNAAFASAAPALSTCASNTAIRLERITVTVEIAHDGSVNSARPETTPAGDTVLLGCIEAALRATDFPEVLGPPMPGFEVPPGEDATRYLIANATASYTVSPQ